MDLARKQLLQSEGWTSLEVVIFPGVRFLLLDPLEIIVDGRPVHLTGRQRVLLSALLLDIGNTVSVKRLADRLWDNDLPPSAPARLRALIAELRRALSPHGRDVILTRSPGYMIAAGAAAVDAEEFASLVENAWHAARDNRNQAALDLYDGALALWRGDPFADLADAVAHAERHRLGELRCEALAERGIKLSSSQVYRLVVDRPERLSLKILMALLDILDCTMEELIEPMPVAGQVKKTKVVGGEAGVGELRPKRARIAPAGE